MQSAPTPSQSEDVMPTSLPQPPSQSEDVMHPSHVHKQNVQLLNIYRGLYDIAQKQKEKEAKEAKERKEQEIDNRLVGSMRSPWTRIKPLKPSPLDVYDTQINAERKLIREKINPLDNLQRKWVRVFER